MGKLMFEECKTCKDWNGSLQHCIEICGKPFDALDEFNKYKQKERRITQKETSEHYKNFDMARKFIEKKILPEYFMEVLKDNKHFEIRKDEDNAQVGDALILKEWDGKKFTGRKTGRNITYVLRNVPEYGLQEGYCIIGW